MKILKKRCAQIESDFNINFTKQITFLSNFKNQITASSNELTKGFLIESKILENFVKNQPSLNSFQLRLALLSLFTNPLIKTSSKLLPTTNSTENIYTNEVFHKQCDGMAQTLFVITSKEEPQTIFGGFAYPKWHFKNAYIAGEDHKPSWLFKITLGEDQFLHLYKWKCINKAKELYGRIINDSNMAEFGNWNLLLSNKCNENNSSFTQNQYKEYSRVELCDVMRKGVENSEGIGEGAFLYYLVSQFLIQLPPSLTTKSILNESEIFNFTVKELEVFKIKFK